jgi:hypothetical protein
MIEVSCATVDRLEIKLHCVVNKTFELQLLLADCS